MPPRELTTAEVYQTIERLCQRVRRPWPNKAGYDGVEVMGSEGYLINEFIAARTNQRTDEWGGSLRKPHASFPRSKS